MKKRYDIDDFYKLLLEGFENGEEKTEFPSHFFKAFYDGDRSVYQKQKTESKKFDMMWIRTIESYFPSLNRITIYVKSTLKYQSEIIPIEKAKKINRESVMHLMSHSNLIKEVNEEGSVIPKQIQTSLSETDYGIYENRFVMTLILRLHDFVGRRVKLMRECLKSTKVTHLNLNNSFSFEDADYEMLLDIKQTENANQRKVDEHNEMVLERAEKLYKLISRLYTSQFMKVMKRYKKVCAPIMKTQIILKNPDFKNAYLLWLFLDKYNELDYVLNIETINKRFTPEYNKNLDQGLLMMFSTMLVNDKAKNLDKSIEGKVKYKEKKAKTLENLPTEIDTTPIAYEVEDSWLNEYYLNRSRNVLKKQIEAHSEDSPNKSIALKKALVDTMQITNSLYESYFEINADADVFQRLVTESDADTMFKEAYEKYKICKTITEVKEKDFLQSVKLEKKWQRELNKYQNAVLKQEKTISDKKAFELAQKQKEKLDKESQKRNDVILKNKMELVKKQKKELADYEKKLKENLRQEKAKMKEAQKLKIQKEKERLKKQAILQRQKDAEKLKLQKEKSKLEKIKKKEKMMKDMLDKKQAYKDKLEA